MDSELSWEFQVKVGMHQGSVLSTFLFTFVVDVVPELANECVSTDLLHTDDFVLMSGTIKGLRDRFGKWKECFEGRGSNVNLGKAK